MEKAKDDLPILLFETVADWRAWLEAHHTKETGVWLKIAKKSAGKKTVSYAEAVDESLCYGWIDGLMNAYNDAYYIQRFTPRRKKSIWYKVNTEKVVALMQAGRMHAAGLAEVEAAKADGRWDSAYEPSSKATMPEDFQQALAKNNKAKEFFDSLTKVNQYAFYFRLQNTKKPELRQAKIEKFIQMLEEGKKFY